MNFDATRDSSRTPPATLRTRRIPSRNVNRRNDSDQSTVTSLSRQSALNAPYSRDPSPIPSKHPSRALTSIRDSPGTTVSKKGGPHSAWDTQRTSLAGFWEAPWSSIQGLATQFLNGSDASTETPITRPAARKRRPLAATHDRTTSAPPAQWGPSGTAGKELGKGSQEDRLAKVQAKKREGLLAANGHVMPDVSGRFKRRDSNERDQGSIPPSDLEDRDMLVYLHEVQPKDTLAGVMIKYNCQANAFRKANRLWPNDRIQIRKVVMLPVEACGVKGRKIPDAASIPKRNLVETKDDDFMPTPTASNSARAPWASLPKPPNNNTTNHELPFPSAPSSPSISVTGPEGSDPEPIWKHDSWVQIDGFVSAVEIARLPRRTLGFFPRSRRKSNSFSDVGTSPPPSSLDLPRPSFQDNSPRRTVNKSRSSSNSTNFPLMRGPGGVGTLGKDVRGPGPAPDGLNKLFAKHLPDVSAPRDSSFESTRSNASSSGNAGLENMGGKIENWVRKMAEKAVKGAATRGSAEIERRGRGDAIELTGGAFEVGQEDEDSRGRDHRGKMEERLQERFPPRGRVFEESSRRR